MKIETERLHLRDLPVKERGKHSSEVEIRLFVDTFYDAFTRLRGKPTCLVFDPELKREWVDAPDRDLTTLQRKEMAYVMRPYMRAIRNNMTETSHYDPRATYLGKGKFALWWKLNRRRANHNQRVSRIQPT